MNMTTELAQRMKAAALKAKQANDLYLEGKITLFECVVETKDHLDYSDNPNNTLALVEALEARDKQIAELRVSNRILCSDAMAKQERIAELEARTLIVKLPDEVSWEQEQFREEVIEILHAAGVAVEGE